MTFNDKLSRAASAVNRVMCEVNADDPIADAYGLGYMGPSSRTIARRIEHVIEACGMTVDEYARELRKRVSEKFIFDRGLLHYVDIDPYEHDSTHGRDKNI